MAKLIAMYKMPKDATAFDAYYFKTHVPLAKTMPGLRRYEVSKGPVLTPAGPSAYYLFATLHFDSLEAIAAAFASPEGKATAADLSNFATGGVEVAFHDSRDV
jgi:uncharacterized protein (TIGR02118 family)